MLEDTQKPANEIGTLYHLVMSEIDLAVIRQNGVEAVLSEIDRLICEDIVSADDIRYIDAEKIKAFFDSDIGKRLLASKNIKREMPFQINISALDYDPTLSDLSRDDNVILQGIIDCFFEENGSFILFDYKTDKVKNNAAEIKERYLKQLELYKRAIEQLTGKAVTETYLYLFDSGETV